MSTPDLKVLVGLFSDEKTAAQNFYVDWMTRRFLPDATYCKEVFLINNAFRAWGHEFLYDREVIEITMKKVGFKDVRYYHPGVSDDENLRDIESHGNIMGCEEINQFEAFAVEGDVPDVKNQNRDAVGKIELPIPSRIVPSDRQTIAATSEMNSSTVC